MRVLGAVALLASGTLVLSAGLATRSWPFPGHAPAAAPVTSTGLPPARAVRLGSPPPVRPSAGDAFAPAAPVLLKVPVQGQLPELRNGCEVTSLSMLLSFVGEGVGKMQLAREQETDPAQPVFAPGRRGDLSRILAWGDPAAGFVGNVYGPYGYGIHHAPLARLLARKVPGRAVDLTGRGFADVLARVRSGMPVLVWTTTTMRPTSRWVTWRGPRGPVRATFSEHAVLLVGYTRTALVVNDPLTGRQESVAPAPFVAAWRQLGRQALTVAPTGG
ncbi:MAG: hypothetical protein JWN35_378 [Frankiales bacterium]|nr:hypothetical protein [Frankiales bacterium]